MCCCAAHVLGLGLVLRLLDMSSPVLEGMCRTGVGAQAAVYGRAIVAFRVCGNPVCKHLDSLPQLHRMISAQPPQGAAGPSVQAL